MRGIAFFRVVVVFALTSLVLVQSSPTLLLSDVMIAAERPGGLSAWASTAPMIDGYLRPGYVVLGDPYPAEWADAHKTSFNLIWGVETHDAHLYVMNDYVNLYIAFEIKLEDYAPTDHVWINFDNNDDNNKTIGDNALYLDANGAYAETFAGRYQDGFWPTEGEGYPSSDDFTGGTNDGVGACKFSGATLYSGNYTFEFAFPLNTSDNTRDFSLEVGDTVGFNILYMDSGGGPDSEAGWPTLTKVDWSQMATILIAGPPLPPPPSQVNIKIDRIEITQAIQWLDSSEYDDNSVPLARGKSTIVRVYLKDRLWRVPNVEVYLYATTSGWSRALPGLFVNNGPLLKVFDAPHSSHRADAEDTANFLLPDYWVEESHVTLKAFVKTHPGQEETDYADNWMNEQTFSFTTTKSLRIGYYLIDYRPTAVDPAPNTPSPDKAARAYEFFEKVTPMPDLFDPIEYVYLDTIRWEGPSFTEPDGDFSEENQEVLIAELNEKWRRLAEEGDFYDVICGLYGGTVNTTIGQANGQNGNWPNIFVAHEDRPWSFAHELGHNLPTGLPHSWSDSSNPYDNHTQRENSSQTFGYDTQQNWFFNLEPQNTVKTPLHLVGGNYGALMSYKNAYRWISPYEWERFLVAFDPPAEGLSASTSNGIQSSSQGIRVSGVIYGNNTGNLQHVFQTAQFLNYTSPTGPYVVELRGSPPAEPLLYSQSFNISLESDACDEGLPSVLSKTSFLLDLPYMTEAYSISLWNTTISPPTLLDKTTASPNPPSVTITYPNGGETLGSSFDITWTAFDPDTGGDPTAFRLFYSNDAGASWKPLSPCVTGSNYTVDASGLPGGDHCLIRVLASDGFHTSTDQSDSVFSVPLKSPMNVFGIGVGPCMTYSFGEPVLLKGSAFDPEDGVLQDSALTWTSDINGMLGTGRILTAMDLLPGIHNITLTATDTNGNNATRSFEVTVELHDVAVTNGTPAKTIVGEGYNLTTNVTVENVGLSNETLNITFVMYRINVSTVNIGLYGHATEGWGFSPSNMISPGPTITVKQWDTVKLTLTSADSLTHNFFVDYNGDALPTLGEPTSADFTTTITYQFVADMPGAFVYYCQYHSSVMLGTFIVGEPDYLDCYQDRVANEEYLDTAEQRISLRNHSTPCLIKGYHVVGVYAGPAPKEFKTIDNLFSGGVVYVGTAGDVDGNHIINMLDLYRVALNFGKTAPYTSYDVANCDIDDNRMINMLDLYITATNFGKIDP